MNVAKSVSDPRSPWWRWSLKELTVAIGYIAVFLAMVSYMGYQNGMFWLCAIASSIITIVCLIFLPRRNAAVPASIVTLVMFLLCNPMLMFFSAVLAINGSLHFGLLARSKTKSEVWSVKQVLLRSSSLTFSAFAIGIWIGLPAYLELVDYKRQIQLTNLSGRLAYEKHTDSENSLNAKFEEIDRWPNTAITLGADFKHKEEVLTDAVSWGRVRSLKGLHNGQVEKFIKSPGFGIGRFSRESTRKLYYPELQDITFGEFPDEKFDELHDAYWWGFDTLNWSEQIQDNRSLHWESVLNFADPESWGFIAGPKQALGFRPHGFTLPLQNMGKSFLAHQNLKLDSLQLISLLRFESPRAYVLDHLPRMDQLVAEDVPTRELTKFEHASIDQLRAAHKLVRSQSTPDDGLEMVGAIRAYESCLGCHNVCRGDMLGAFTYQFEYASGPPANSSTEKLQ